MTYGAAPPPPPPPGLLPPAPPVVWGAYRPAPPAVVATHVPRKHGHVRLLVILSSCLAALVLVTSVVSALTAPKKAAGCTGPACTSPPVVAPVGPQHTYVSSAYGYSVGYTFPDDVNATSHSTATGLVLDYPLPDGAASITFDGVRAADSSSQQVVDSYQSQYFAGATMAYSLMNPMVGYQQGYGAVYNYYPQSGNGSATHERVVIVAAIEHGLAVVGVASGPYQQWTSSSSPTGDLPSALDVAVGDLFDDPLNSVRWPGNPLR